MHISLLRDLLHNEAHEYFLSPFYYLKSRENHTDQMTKNELMAVTLIRQRPQVQVLTRGGVKEYLRISWIQSRSKIQATTYNGT